MPLTLSEEDSRNRQALYKTFSKYINIMYSSKHMATYSTNDTPLNKDDYQSDIQPFDRYPHVASSEKSNPVAVLTLVITSQPLLHQATQQKKLKINAMVIDKKHISKIESLKLKYTIAIIVPVNFNTENAEKTGLLDLLALSRQTNTKFENVLPTSQSEINEFINIDTTSKDWIENIPLINKRLMHSADYNTAINSLNALSQMFNFITKSEYPIVWPTL